MQKEEYGEWMSIDEDIPLAATITDLEIFQVVCEQDQSIKVDDSDGDKCVEENSPTKAETRKSLDILKRGEQHHSTNFKKTKRMTTPGLAAPSPNFRTTPAGGCLAFYVRFNVQQIHIHSGSSVEGDPSAPKPKPYP
ncbi:hypothetical protein AVEN_125736-1 [Araneus ventricosus]|uniref:Uncharacterized protein n=1 Tax=Araneus ventricosus TaxID=182803 RepID=A0A4Y2U3D4_ARAVE|nr:hypothetical protein AVEN_125736-1 [Araneus ventricosus]